MHVPPSYKVQVKLSWKPAAEAAAVAAKRPSTGGNAAAKPKAAKPGGLHMDRAVYAPPTGKFSEKAGSAPGRLSPLYF